MTKQEPSFPASATGVAAKGPKKEPSRLKRAFETYSSNREPLHLQIRKSILDILAQGYWSPGDKLPAERDIADDLGISLGTVQKTLIALAADGVLVRKHGHGTFVAGDATQSARLIHFRFEGEDGTSIAPVYAEAIERRIVRERGAWSQFLTDSRSVIMITRRVNVADEFDCISDFYIDADDFSPLMDMPLEQLHKIIIREFIASNFNAPTINVTQSIACGTLPERVCTLLKANTSNIGMVLTVRSWTHGDRPIAFQKIFIPAGARPLEIPTPRLR